MAAARNLKKSPFEIRASRLQISRGNFWEQLVRVTRMTDQAKKGLLIIYSELIVCNFFSLCPGETKVANRGLL